MKLPRWSIVPAGLLVVALESGVGFALSIGVDKEPRPREPYSVLEDGRTIGKLPAGEEPVKVREIPDLVAVVGDKGVEGFAESKYILGTGEPAPRSPAEALEMQRSRAATTVVPVYADDGVTIVDTFTIDNRPITGTDPEQG